jgi:hypothetical protein
LYKEDRGVNKLDSEAMNVHNYVERCKDIDGYEFLSGVNSPIPYVPSTKRGDVRGRYVRITINNTQDSENWLQLAEVQVISNNRNIAQGKSTSSSGNYPGSSNSKANDGNNDGNWNAGSVYHSGNGSWNNSGGPQFWEVDLGDASQTVDRIIISNRTDCCGGRLNNWLLSIHDYNRNLIWARIYSDPPNPKMSIDVLMSNNDINNPKVKDYRDTEFNRLFYRVGNSYRTINRSNANHYGACVQDVSYGGTRKKWVGGDMPCRDYYPGEWEEEERQRIERERLAELERQRLAAIAQAQAEADRKAAAKAEADRKAAEAHQNWLNTRCGGNRRADRCSSGCERRPRWWERCHGPGGWCCT